MAKRERDETPTWGTCRGRPPGRGRGGRAGARRWGKARPVDRGGEGANEERTRSSRHVIAAILYTRRPPLAFPPCLPFLSQAMKRSSHLPRVVVTVSMSNRTPPPPSPLPSLPCAPLLTSPFATANTSATWFFFLPPLSFFSCCSRRGRNEAERGTTLRRPLQILVSKGQGDHRETTREEIDGWRVTSGTLQCGSS